MERTLVIVKPDGVQRGLVTAILGLKMLAVTRDLAETHYAVHKGKFFYDGLVQYITSGPVVAAVIEGPEVIGSVRMMVGKTRPHESPPGTIRGDYAVTGLRNLIHASDAPETASAEIALWFRPDELVEYARDVDKWIFE
jgi:nucleoside-diphosphate kinase